MQVMENSFEVDKTAASNPQGWIQGWAQLVTAVTTNAVAAPRVIISVIGNPDAGGLKFASVSLPLWICCDCRTHIVNLSTLKRQR